MSDNELPSITVIIGAGDALKETARDVGVGGGGGGGWVLDGKQRELIKFQVSSRSRVFFGERACGYFRSVDGRKSAKVRTRRPRSIWPRGP